MKRTTYRPFAPAGLLGLAAILALSTSSAGNKVTTESVNDYWGNGDLPNSIANGNGFRSTITSTGFWSAGLNYTNGSVYDTDFVDPQKSGSAVDNDTSNFDRAGDAIAYFTGHGIGQAGGGACTSSSQCTSPPAGASGNGYCRASPPNQASCVYTSPRALVTMSNNDQHGHLVHYGNGQTALGDGSYGNFFGAGTNGGVNLAVFDISHGVTSMFWSEELVPAFAGLHLLATIMPINGDTANVSNRGTVFANQFVANPNGSVATAWMETLNSIPQAGYWGCGGGVNDFTYGGGHGINGCGCNFIMSVDSSTYWSNWHINNETWTTLKEDYYDGDAAVAYTWEAICNYDLASYPWGL